MVPFISAGRKGGGGGKKFFKGGPIFSENIGPPGPFFFLEIFGLGGLFLGGPIVT